MLNEKGHSSELQILIFLIGCGLAVAVPFSHGHNGLWHGLSMALLALPLGLLGLVLAIICFAKPIDWFGKTPGVLLRVFGSILGFAGLIAALWLPAYFAAESLHDPGGKAARGLTYLSIALWVTAIVGVAVLRWRAVVAARKERAAKAS